jgi:PPP family 3-phenylpropionic acid transporter
LNIALGFVVLSKSSTLRAYYFAAFASIGIFLPFVSPWLHALGVRGTTLGIISATRPITGIFAPVLFGWLADSLGLRGSLLRLACFGALLPFAVLSLVAYYGYHFSWFLLLTTVAVSSFFRVPMMTIADVSALEHKKSYGSLRLWGSLGFLVSSLIAGKVVDPTLPFNFPVAMMCTYLLAFAISFRFPTRVSVPRKPKKADLFTLLRHPPFSRLLTIMTLWAIAHVAYDLCVSLHLRALGASPFEISIAWNIGVVAEIALMASWSRLRGLAKSEHWLAIGVTFTALRFLAIALAPNLTIVLWLQPLHALSFAAVWMAQMQMVTEYAPHGMLGTAQGLLSTAIATGAAIGMLFFAPLYERLGGPTTFAAAAAVALVALAISRFKFQFADFRRVDYATESTVSPSVTGSNHKQLL